MMRDCEDGEMRDLLPGYALGTLSAAEHAEVSAHLVTCGDCAAELEVIEAASRAFPAPKIDVSKIVKALPKAPKVSSRPFFATRIGQLAAAVGIMAVGALSVLSLRGYFTSDSPAVKAVSAGGRSVASVDTAKRSVVAAHDTTAVAVVRSPERGRPASKARGDAGISFGGGLSDLTDEQLDALMAELDTLDALPSVEPESHLSPIVPIVPPADGGHDAI
jgi:anti-sigma factor RsiW